MNTLVALLEEPSAAVFLKALMPRVLPSDWTLQCISFEGKQDLERGLVRKLRGWLKPDSHFLVMRDRDSDDCRNVKKKLVEMCRQAGHPNALVRIACGELESFYLGDLEAVARVYGCSVSRSAKYRDPDRLNNAADELRRLTCGAYQKISGSRMLAPILKLDGQNRSRSFNALISGVRRLLAGRGE